MQLFAQPCPADYAGNTDDIIWTDTGGPESNDCPPFPPGTAQFGTGAGLNPIVTDIVAAFNNARTVENAQILTTIPLMTTAQLGGSDAAWNANTEPQKALILMNLERVARGIPPFQEVDPNVQSVAQSYAEYLIANNAFDHDLNCIPVPVFPETCGPTYRMAQQAAIKNHQEAACRSENLSAYFWPTFTPSCAPHLPVERAVYGWIYTDVTQTNGHRKACLYNIPLANDNYSTGGAEGQIGIGIKMGAPYRTQDNGLVIVFNFFDPDASYNPALPVELTTFTASLNSKKVELSWQTAT
ncbi:MAG: hypothetical protein KDC90_19790, partial [Ignavibacteriae bacterium]|nr:hypothetical protein [Ignavibacteriota bacterium]